MAAAPDERRVERILEDSIDEALALELALQAERVSLEARDDAGLRAAAGEKELHVARLEQLDADRKASGITDLHAGARWQAFLSIMARCKRMNTTNGAIIHLRRQQVNDALRLVSGAGAGTYGPSGTESSSAGRALAAV